METNFKTAAELDSSSNSSDRETASQLRRGSTRLPLGIICQRTERRHRRGLLSTQNAQILGVGGCVRGRRKRVRVHAARWTGVRGASDGSQRRHWREVRGVDGESEESR